MATILVLSLLSSFFSPTAFFQREYLKEQLDIADISLDLELNILVIFNSSFRMATLFLPLILFVRHVPRTRQSQIFNSPQQYRSYSSKYVLANILIQFSETSLRANFDLCIRLVVTVMFAGPYLITYISEITFQEKILASLRYNLESSAPSAITCARVLQLLLDEDAKRQVANTGEARMNTDFLHEKGHPVPIRSETYY